VDFVKSAVDAFSRMAVLGVVMIMRVIVMVTVLMIVVTVLMMFMPFIVVAFTLFDHFVEAFFDGFSDVVKAGLMKMLDGLVSVANSLLPFRNFAFASVFTFLALEMPSDFTSLAFQSLCFITAALIDQTFDLLPKFVKMSF